MICTDTSKGRFDGYGSTRDVYEDRDEYEEEYAEDRGLEMSR